ncbi:DUF4394 domain-containing protein [Hymenobacter lucidus]|uniref:DUF4394 domain-containing protein n=1 Tax=Hymenobacter lucidus TaxID=2880930 RepID=A0ABS8ARE2_9BACT|nr:DUF4394 domain-containing protein [Hymenobacter lucidus]MCB2408792.1 DUF4394 domain-containing protein [Hymenobacter lucidus]
MPIPLLLPAAPAADPTCWLRRTTLAAALLLAGAPAATAQTVFGLSGTDLTSIELTSPTTRTRKTITGLTPGMVLVGIDFRPATGQLYALGYNGAGLAQLYTINYNSPLAVNQAPATAIGSTQPLALGTATDRIGFDFNPTVDRIRVVSTNDANYRLNPNDGTITANDDALAYTTTAVPADPNAGQNPYIGAAAYTNSFIGATATTLYTVDEQRSVLTIQAPPNDGTLNTVTTISVPVPLNTPGVSADLDIYTNPTTRAQKAYLSINAPDPDPARTGQFITALYALNLTNGTLTLEGGIGGGSPFDPPTNANPFPGITDIAIGINRTAPTPSGQLLYAVTTTGNLISFNSGQPGFLLSSTAITGLTAGQTLVGTDFRPNTGQLFGLGYDPASRTGRLYIIDRSTAVATPVGAAAVPLDLGTTPAALNGIGFDFNPTVDRIRVTGLTTRNYRLNPNNGVVTTDGDLNFVSGATGTPTIGAVAYTNSYVGSTSTTLYDIDDVRNQLFIQSNPNLGQLTAAGATGLLPSSGAVNDLDFYFDAATQANRGFLVSNADAATTTTTFSTLYSLDPSTGASPLGVIGLGIPVRDVTAFLAPLTQPNLIGRLIYGVAGGNLVSFDSGAPNNIRTAVNITGLPADGSQVLAGIDFRPLDGQLFALGYNATAQTGQLYTLDLSTGALTPVGGLNTYSLGAASGVGFDFNPVADRIRIVGSNGNNYRLNPADGILATASDGPTGRALSGAAYTNNDNNAATGTALYAYDQSTNQVVLINDPNTALSITNIGSSNTAVNTATGVEFDIYSDLANPALPNNSAFAAAAPNGVTSESLWEVSLTTGAFNQLGRIGSGSNLSGMAAFLTPAFSGLTWTGAIDTDWGKAGNWSPAQVPQAADNVTIPNTTNDPVVSSAFVVNSVTLGSGATLTSADGSLLTINGNFTNNGGTTLGSLTGRVSFGGPSGQVISGTTTFFTNLSVGTPLLTATGPVQVQRVLQVFGNFVAGNNLTLLSNASGTATVVNQGSGVVTGTVVVQRYIAGNNAGLGYRHYSSPIQNATVSEFITPGYTPVVNPDYNTVGNTVTPFPTVFGYDQARVTTSGNPAPEDFEKGFFSPASLADPLTAGRGYTVNIPGTETVDFAGTLNNGPIAVGSLSRGTQTESGWQLLGNPYPSPIDWDLVGRTNVDGAVYVYRSSGPYEGTYSSYVAGSGGVGINGGTDQIALGQGFFVRVSTPNTTNGQVSFANVVRVTDGSSPVFQRGTAATDASVRLELRGSTGPADEALVYFNTGATAAFDPAFDAYKLTASGAPMLATATSNDVRLSINALPALTSADVTIPLRLEVAQAGTYSLRASALLNLPTGTYAYLRDAQTGAVVDLAQQASYSFTTSAGTQAPRFTLLLTQAKVLASASATLAQQVSIYPNPAQQTVFISLPTALRQQAVAATLVNSLGQVVLRHTLPARATDNQALPLSGVSKGVYTLRLLTAEGVVNKRLVVE